MSLADACIVRMAEIYERHAVLTLDSDFSVYRKHGRVPLVREKGIPPRISEGGSHALCRGDVADLAYRPFRGEPFPGRMRKNGREAEKAGLFIDARCLDRRYLVPAKALAHDVQPAPQRGIAEGAIRLARKRGSDGGNERLLWIR